MFIYSKCHLFVWGISIFISVSIYGLPSEMYYLCLGKYVVTEEGTKRVKCYLLSGIFDAPAKSIFQNMIQFNGKYGCPYCLEPGETYKSSARGHVHIYPFNVTSNSGHCQL